MKTKTGIEELPDGEKVDSILQLQQKLQEAEARISRREELQKIYKLWIKNREKRYPDNCRGESIKGIDLDYLHQTIVGCITTFLTRERVSPEQREYFYASNDDLEWVARELQGYEGYYFRQLKAVVSSVIEYERQAAEVVS
jgi:hypothetical protein